jgi:hypothetical protein
VRWLLVVAGLSVGVASPAYAWPNDTPDAASVPDASVDQGGAQQGQSQETDSTKPSPCLSNSDCDNGMACVDRTCVYQHVRNAKEEGCGGSAAVMLVPLGLGVTRRRRRS